QLNTMGEAFVRLALPMLVSSTALAALVLLVEFVLRARVRAGLRYWLVTCVLAYLVLTPLLSLSPPSTHWPSGTAAYASPLPAPASHPGTLTGDTAPGETGTAPLSRPATGDAQTTLAGVGEQPCTLTWQGVAFLFWLAGATIMGVVLTCRALAACKQVDKTLAANHLMNDILAYCRKRMGVQGPVRLRIGEEGTAPVVCGLVSPVIVVPRNLAPTLGSRHLRDVLFHELAHVKRHDLWVNLAQNVLQVLYFYNPLLLVINAVIRRLREEATDETVLDTIGDTDHAYADRLAEVATLATKPPAPSLNLVGVA
ncbi:MAG: M56 family metallopeptidase, partial [Planctomycetes bacterium]|nr:M56 family metallopeptidase [Planctomycetota bacterium]